MSEFLLLKNARPYGEGGITDLLIKDGKIVEIAQNLTLAEFKACVNADGSATYTDISTVIDCKGLPLIPAAVDVHTHTRTPGFEHKEDAVSFSNAAAKGGVSCVMAMPNTNPVPDSIENLKEIQTALRNGKTRIYFFAAITKGSNGRELTDISLLSKQPCIKGFSDDGRGVTDIALLKKAVIRANQNGKIIAAHSESTNPDFEKRETEAVLQEVAMLRELQEAGKKPKYHFCHISNREALESVIAARKDGIDVTFEVTPHHFSLTKSDIKNTNYKMSPPLREETDKTAILHAIASGAATIVATDHAPHTEDEKARGYDNAPNGIIGLETLIPLVYTELVKTGIISLRTASRLITDNPASRFGLPFGEISVTGLADLVVPDTETTRIYTKAEIQSKSKNSPFIGRELTGFPVLTIVNGKVVYNNL
ncbi:MAG: dihydroorotase [Christensenellaceae bacterium]|jgi:dihydroorotase|nr:dihydroorotase [Christensenellaceae bacterium]